MEHPFFADINIEAITKKEVPPPYTPEIGDDLVYFDQKLTSREEFTESVIDSSNMLLVQKNKHMFEKF